MIRFMRKFSPVYLWHSFLLQLICPRKHAAGFRLAFLCKAIPPAWAGKP